jgi:acetyltransferase-like isoleucine patch superfamily enzyme
MLLIQRISAFVGGCKRANVSAISVFFRRLYYSLIWNKPINCCGNVKIRGLKNVQIKKMLSIGMNPEGFVVPNEKTYLNIQGELRVKKSLSIGRGCSVSVEKGGCIEVGEAVYVNSFTKFMIGDRLTIGDWTIISWNCQFLNEGTHKVDYPGRRSNNKSIFIGNNVWIGNNVKVYAGAKIPDNCVVASDSVVKTSFGEKGVLIGGNPAKILRRGVTWSR